MVGETTVEQSKSPEARRPSNGLMLHIAHGEFDNTKTSSLDKNPEKIANASFNALQYHHDNARKKQQEQQYDQIRKAAEADPEFHGQLTPEMMRHLHFIAWAKVESIRIGAMFRQEKSSPEGQEALKNALGKLHIVIDDNVDATNLPDQFYNTSSNTHGEPGKFYKEFCTGNTNKKLVETLSEQEMIVLKDFLIDTLGSKTAYDALIVTKQTQDAIEQHHDFSTDSSSLPINEYGILEFFGKGVRAPVETESTAPETLPKAIKIEGGYTTAHPEHPDRNDDTSFIDMEHLRGGIFDGAGGYAGGDRASRAAMEAVKEVMDRFPLKGDFPENPIREQFLDAFALANDHVKALGSGMTTAAVFQVVRSAKDGSPKLLVANIGDSRVWIRHKDGTVTQVTRDGSALRDLHKKALKDIPSGSQDPRFQEERDEATEQYEDMQAILDSAQSDNDFATQPKLKAAWHLRNQTNLLGSDDFKDGFEFFESPINEGDTVFMTTDGVHDNLTREQIAEIAKTTTDPDELSKHLVQRARVVADTRGTPNQQFRAKPDDITAVATLFSSTDLTSMEHAHKQADSVRTNTQLQVVESIVQKLDERTPGAGVERLVAEKNFTPDEIIAMRELLHKVTSSLSANKDLADLRQMADSYQKTDQAFGIAMTFGGAVKENAAVTSPIFKQDENGTRIEVSPDLYRLWKTYSESQFLTHTLDDYTAKPLDKTNAVYGRSPYQVARALETIAAYTTSLEEKS